MIFDMDTPSRVHPSQELDSVWGFPLQRVVCNKCGWGYLAPGDLSTRRCPHCFKADLSIIENSQEASPQDPVYGYSPELVVPFTLSQEKLAANVQTFSQGIPFPPTDLKAENLAGRLQRIFIPVWLVDASVRAAWQGEAGFNYEVISHQEHYTQFQGGWKSREVTETRVRWEPRRGRLDRVYHNNPVIAVEGDAGLKKLLGQYQLDSAHTYLPETARQACVRLPDRNSQDAWRELLPALRSAAAEDCRRAAAADHLRDFRWQPDFYHRNWTLLLLPLYATYYLDDENQTQPVYLEGQSGKAIGERRSSMKRAWRRTAHILAIAGGIFLVSVVLALAGIMIEPLVIASGVGMAITLLVAMGAIIPPVIAWQFNRSQQIET